MGAPFRPVPNSRRCKLKYKGGARCGNWRKSKKPYCSQHLKKLAQFSGEVSNKGLKLSPGTRKAQREAAKVHECVDRKFIARVRWLADGVAQGHIGREDAFDLIKKAL
jgi:hypothetical protein